MFFIILIVFSCKKKEDPVPANNTSANNNQPATTGSTTGTTNGATGGSTTNGSTTGGTSGGTTVPTFGQHYNGMLTIRTLTDATTPQIKILTEADAFFARKPIVEFADSLGVNVGQVLFNGTPLMFYQTSNTYSLGSVKSNPESKWSVADGNTIPEFIFDATFAAPVWHNPEVLPHSISRSTGTTITLNLSSVISGSLLLNVTSGNATSGTITIETGLAFIGGHSTLEVTPDFMDFLAGADSGSISLKIENAVTKNINGKELIFRKESVYTQVLQITP